MPLNFKPPHPPRHPGINSIIPLGRWIERFFGRHGVFLDLESEGEDRGESVCELQDADCAHKAGNVGELRDGGADHPCESPVSWDESDPEEFSGFGGEGWGV